MERILVLIEVATDIVQNVIIADGDYDPPAGIRAIEAPGARIGWLWNNGEQVDPNPAPPEEILE